MRERLDRSGVVKEFGTVSLGDARLDNRLERIATLLAQSPAASFPEAMRTEADQEALYRFLGNKKVAAAKLLAAHADATRKRASSRSRIRVLHDTTEFSFEGDRDGLGILHEKTNGFFGHFALAVAGDEQREPLGILDVHTYINTRVEARRGLTKYQKSNSASRQPRSQKKSARWENRAIEVSKDLPENLAVVHVMDREADDLSVLTALDGAGMTFVIRADPQRLTKDRTPVAQLLAQTPARSFRRPFITRRSSKAATRQHPARNERIATLYVRSSVVTFCRAATKYEKACEVSVCAVHVFEPEPPQGEAPIEWMLLTNDVVTTDDDIARTVDDYRSRWMIEEYFKALKTGCAFEKRQLCTYDGLLRALALFVPMAWQLLRLRHLAQTSAESPASSILKSTELKVLRQLLASRGRNLAPEPSARDVLLGIAALGGHIKNNGDPGWLVLGRGFERFADALEVREALRGSDQS